MSKFTIIKAPSQVDGPVLSTTVTNETAPVKTLVHYLAALIKYNPAGLVDLFSYNLWDSIALDSTEFTTNDSEVYGVGFLDDEAELYTVMLDNEEINALDTDTYILFGTKLIFWSAEIIGGRSLTELLDPAMNRYYKDEEYFRYDLLDPMSWPLKDIGLFRAVDGRIQENMKMMGGADETEAFMG